MVLLFEKQPLPKQREGEIGLYVRDILPSGNRFDFVSILACILVEIQHNTNKYLLVVLYGSAYQTHA